MIHDVHCREGSKSIERLTLACCSICFLGGATTHLLDMAHGGWLPYRFAPYGVNLFWSSLTLIDCVVAALLWRSRRTGLILALSIMLIDVGVNSYLIYGLKMPLDFAALQLQSAFLGFIAGSITFLWPRLTCPIPATETARDSL